MCNEYLEALHIDCSQCEFFMPEANCEYTKEAFVKWLYAMMMGQEMPENHEE